MQQKKILRKKYFQLRKKKYYKIKKDFFTPFVNLIKSKFKKKIKLAIYYPATFEVDALRVLEFKHVSLQNTLLPIIEENNLMNFFPWKKNEVLQINKFGMLEPIKSQLNIPEVMLVPLLVFDKNKYRLGYGKGFYDRYLTIF